MHKDVRKLVQQLTVIPGVEVVQGGKHLRVLKDGKFVSALPLTPSDHRWRDNAVAELKAQGITPGRKLDVCLRVTEEGQGKLRASLLEEFKRKGAQADFARFLMEAAPVLGVKGPANFRSAEATLHSFKGGGGLSANNEVLVAEGLRLWRGQRNGQARASQATVPLPLPSLAAATAALTDAAAYFVPDDFPVLTALKPGTVSLEIDLEKVNEFLGKFGVKLAFT